METREALYNGYHRSVFDEVNSIEHGRCDKYKDNPYYIFEEKVYQLTGLTKNVCWDSIYHILEEDVIMWKWVAFLQLKM